MCGTQSHPTKNAHENHVNRQLSGRGSNPLFGLFARQQISSGPDFHDCCGDFGPATYKERSTLVSIVPKITARSRQMDFCIFCEKSRRNEKLNLARKFNL